MYIDSLAYQTREFMYAYGFGFILGVIYDLTRIIRLLVYQGKKKVFIWDIIYAVVASFLCVIFSLGVCDGKLYFYIAFGIVLGFFTYYFALGTIVVRLSNRIIVIIKKFFSLICKPIKKIVARVAKSVRKVAKVSFNKIKKNQNKSKKLLQVDKRMMYNRKSKCSKKQKDVNERGIFDEEA